jgi:hypothetical protein
MQIEQSLRSVGASPWILWSGVKLNQKNVLKKWYCSASHFWAWTQRSRPQPRPAYDLPLVGWQSSQEPLEVLPGWGLTAEVRQDLRPIRAGPRRKDDDIVVSVSAFKFLYFSLLCHSIYQAYFQANVGILNNHPMAQPWEADGEQCRNVTENLPLRLYAFPFKMYSSSMIDCPNLPMHRFFQRNCPQAQVCNHKHYQETCSIQNGTRVYIISAFNAPSSYLDNCSHFQVRNKPLLSLLGMISPII